MEKEQYSNTPASLSLHHSIINRNILDAGYAYP